MKTISANYVDRNCSFPWLVRNTDDDARTATAAKSVIASNVRFETSSKYEEAFGCARVAVADSITTSTQDGLVGSDLVQLTFDGYYFVTPTGTNVKAVTTLFLTGDKKMFARL